MASRFTRTVAMATLSLGLLATAAGPASAENIGNQGCTPGYWKNHPAAWQEYRPTTDLRFVFMTGGVSAFDVTSNAAKPYATMDAIDALSLQGGSGADGAVRILLRAATAAFLNAAHEGVGYPERRFVAGGLYEQINAALDSGDRQTMLGSLGYDDVTVVYTDEVDRRG